MSHSVPMCYTYPFPPFSIHLFATFPWYTFLWLKNDFSQCNYVFSRKKVQFFNVHNSIYVTNDTLRIRYVVLSHYCSLRMSLTWYFPAATKIWEMDFYFLLYVLSYGMKAPRFFIHLYVRDIFDIWNVV